MSHNQLATQLPFTAITSDVISTRELEATVLSDEIGACVNFVGRVRNCDHGRSVTSLEYEAHPSATEVLAKIAQQIALQFDGVRIAAVHRTGKLLIGETALGVVVAAEHRGEAISACGALVEEIKALVPIWKLQTFEDGTTEWVNCL